MTTANGEYNLLINRIKHKYTIRELPGCFVVEGSNGSVIVYRTRNGNSMCVCYHDKRDYGEGKEVDEIIDNYCK